MTVQPSDDNRHNIALAARDVRKSLPLANGQLEILKGISFEVAGGEFVSIVGPSGSGKSTLLGIIAGLDRPTSGQVWIDGVDMTGMGERGWRRCATARSGWSSSRST